MSFYLRTKDKSSFVRFYKRTPYNRVGTPVYLPVQLDILHPTDQTINNDALFATRNAIDRVLQYPLQPNRGWQVTCPDLRPHIEVVEYVPPTPKVVVAKNDAASTKALREMLVRAMCAADWKINLEGYYGTEEKNLTRFRGKEKTSADDILRISKGYIHLLSPDSRYAAQLKSNVMTVHDADRQFCKVLSFRFNESEYQSPDIVCGRIRFRIG